MERITVLETEIIETKILKTRVNDYELRIQTLVQDLESKNRKIHELERLLEECNFNLQGKDQLERELYGRDHEIERLKNSLEGNLAVIEDLNLKNSQNEVCIFYLLIHSSKLNKF
jgi:predicted RNase H-like nuclease (RuvC/YqgF family)